ncbi:MAG: endopeptidase La [Dysgonamonadaceae bacterium]|nr:endopeptidase La [Dysgonamonadaceae bacterium]
MEIIIENKPFNPKDLSNDIPILSLKNMMFFPGIPTPVNIGRAKSLKLIQDMQNQEGLLGVFCQKDANEDDPGIDGHFSVGTASKIVNIIQENEDSMTILLLGLKRIHLDEITVTKPYLKGKVSIREDIRPTKSDKEFKAQINSIRDMTMQMLSTRMGLPEFILDSLQKSKDDEYLINLAFSSIEAGAEQKQEVLACDDLKERLNKLLSLLDHDVQLLEIKESIRKKTQVEIDKQQRDYFLQQELKNIQEALGGGIHDIETAEIKMKAEKINFSPEVRDIFNKELKKLERLHPQSPDHATQMTYIQSIISLPWNSYTKDNFNLKRAKKILDKDHFGLEKVKERIIEHLAVLKLKGDMKSPIICLYGPPGVGKTSLGKSVAEALDRRYIRLSLGGLHDEAEIRGHRRTYIGAMSGRIMHSIQKAGSSNPVIILDEIDKVGKDYKGDPSAALLEVLDPEQNFAFHDNYLDIDYDLSKVLFIATANTLETVSQPLIDRMEVIDVSGYILEEKIEIARRHLIPQQMEKHGIPAGTFDIPKKTLGIVIESYTRESGVRGLDKKLAKIMRRVARKIADKENHPVTLEMEHLHEYLGPIEYSREKYQGAEYTGVVTGLAWTAAGGEILFVETSLSKGKNSKLTLTGNLGDVMKESAILALEYIKAHASELGIDEEMFENWNVHVHVPEGAIPKDGPSAGITMASSIASAFSNRKVRKGIAMTGEITLRGKVLPVGGIKEKILAAKRSGIKELILCRENKNHIDEINELYLKGLKFHYVDDIKEVLDIALIK